MSRLTKEEILEKYGPVEGEKRWLNILRSRNNRAKNPEYGRAYAKQYRQANRGQCNARVKKWFETHRDEFRTNLNVKYRENKLYRANQLINSYKRSDYEYSRGECTLTPEWIVENIFTSKCVYCECDDWTKLGCDRIDNFKPHTPDNVVCSCWACNTKRGTTSYPVYRAVTRPLGIKIVYSDD